MKYLHYMNDRDIRQRDALDRVLALNALLTGDLARFEAEHGLTGPRVHLLWQLGLAGPSTQRDLAAALSVSPRNVTGLVDGLVASGHVTREPHPTDRRATLVTLTGVGKRFVADLQASHDDLARQLFGDLPEDRLDSFVEVLDGTLARVARLMDAHAGETA